MKKFSLYAIPHRSNAVAHLAGDRGRTKCGSKIRLEWRLRSVRGRKPTAKICPHCGSPA